MGSGARLLAEREEEVNGARLRPRRPGATGELSGLLHRASDGVGRVVDRDARGAEQDLVVEAAIEQELRGGVLPSREDGKEMCGRCLLTAARRELLGHLPQLLERGGGGRGGGVKRIGPFHLPLPSHGRPEPDKKRAELLFTAYRAYLSKDGPGGQAPNGSLRSRGGITMSRGVDPVVRAALLRAARETFAERGVDAARVEDIASRAGESKDVFFLHFDSKDAIVSELVEGFVTGCKSHFAPPAAYPAIPDDPNELYDFLFERDLAIYEFLWEGRAFFRVMPLHVEAHAQALQSFRMEIAATSREWVEHFKREDFFRSDVNADLAATLIGGAYADLSTRLVSLDRRPPLEEWLDFALETFTRAFGTPHVIRAIERRSAGTGGFTDEEVTTRALARRSGIRFGERGRTG